MTKGPENQMFNVKCEMFSVSSGFYFEMLLKTITVKEIEHNHAQYTVREMFLRIL